MNAEAALAEITGVLTDDLGVPPDRIRPTASLTEDLEMDSLDRTEFLVALEGRLGRTVDAAAVEEVRTVQDVVDVVVATMGERPRPTATP